MSNRKTAWFLAPVLASCLGGFSASQDSQAAALEGSVNADGSSTVYPIAEAVAEEFLREQPRVKIKVGMSGTGGGFKKFCNGEISLNNASRPIKDSEAKECADKKIEFIELPVAYDGLSVVVNPKNTWAKSISKDQLKKLWEPGSSVKTWKDLDPTWPANPIKLYGPGPDSGTFDYFTEEVVGKAKAMRADFTASEDDNVLVNGVSGDQYAIGYFGYAYYIENKSKIKALPIDGGKGPVMPEDATIEGGTYPLSRPLFLVVNKADSQRPEVDAFVKFYLKNAKDLAKAVGYTALPQKMNDDAMKRYETRQAGKWTGSASH